MTVQRKAKLQPGARDEIGFCTPPARLIKTVDFTE
jgi:hypothetical protein